MKIFIVTVWNENEEPVVTVFDNLQAAESYSTFAKSTYQYGILDESYLITSFTNDN